MSGCYTVYNMLDLSHRTYYLTILYTIIPYMVMNWWFITIYGIITGSLSTNYSWIEQGPYNKRSLKCIPGDNTKETGACRVFCLQALGMANQLLFFNTNVAARQIITVYALFRKLFSAWLIKDSFEGSCNRVAAWRLMLQDISELGVMCSGKEHPHVARQWNPTRRSSAETIVFE